jgi:hypothetical protein
MNLGWQDFVALGIVFAALAYLARLAGNAFARKGGSGCASGCGKCSAGADVSTSVPDQVLSIGRIHRGSPREGEAV